MRHACDYAAAAAKGARPIFRGPPLPLLPSLPIQASDDRKKELLDVGMLVMVPFA
jgi:hypothetical protein